MTHCFKPMLDFEDTLNGLALYTGYGTNLCAVFPGDIAKILLPLDILYLVPSLWCTSVCPTARAPKIPKSRVGKIPTLFL